jgi:hypothetical protein
MDDLVRQAMAKWPNVPDCYGWLGLDARGQWYMRDDRAQAAGAFDSGTPGARGSVLRHDKLIEFIHRNYDADSQGRWYFQNGPQRVYVELEATPFIWRIEPDGTVRAHTGHAANVRLALVDEIGHLYLSTDLGLGRVHTQDMHRAADLLESGAWPMEETRAADLAPRFRYVNSPQRDRAAGVAGT